MIYSFKIFERYSSINYETETKKFITKAKKLLKAKDKYDYSNTKYTGYRNKLKIICKKHNNEFEQFPQSHLEGFIGCKLCARESRTKTTEYFIKRVKEVHGDTYDYSLVKYVDAHTPVDIICKYHGIFQQKPCSHITYCKCPICTENKTELFIANELDKLKIVYKRQYKFDDCKHKYKLPFDFYLPKYNICIEYDGFTHFVDTFGQLEYRKKLDNIKSEYCKNNGIVLIRLVNNEYKKIDEILKSHIKRNKLRNIHW
jgi:very-short-patch-repair endonuclease